MNRGNRRTLRSFLSMPAAIAILVCVASVGHAGIIDCNSNGVEDATDIAGETSEDCNTNTIPDECDIDTGTSSDCDNNGIPDDCEPDCNENFIVDACDLTTDCDPACCISARGGFNFCGNSQDCNTNSVPDECEVGPGVILSVWVGGNGDWSEPTNWCPPQLPDNDGKVSYEVVIAGPSSTTSMNLSPTINELTIDNFAELRTFGDRTINVLGNVVIDNGGFYGTQELGRGTIPNSTGMFANNVTILSTTAPGFMDLQDEMSATVFGDFLMDGTGAVCSLRGGSSPPRLRNNSRTFPEARGLPPIPSMTVFGNFQMDVIAEVEVGTDSGMSLFSDWNNFASPSACFDWTEGELLLDGGNLRGTLQVFELVSSSLQCACASSRVSPVSMTFRSP